MLPVGHSAGVFFILYKCEERTRYIAKLTPALFMQVPGRRQIRPLVFRFAIIAPSIF